MKKLSIAIRTHITYEKIKDLLDSASYGSSYWCQSELCYESETDKTLTEGVNLYNSEEDHYEILNLKKIKRGFTAMAKKYPKHFANFISEDYDQNDSDIFLQCCLFGDVIYS